MLVLLVLLVLPVCESPGGRAGAAVGAPVSRIFELDGGYDLDRSGCCVSPDQAVAVFRQTAALFAGSVRVPLLRVWVLFCDGSCRAAGLVVALFDRVGDPGGVAGDGSVVDDSEEHCPGVVVAFEQVLLDVFCDVLALNVFVVPHRTNDSEEPQLYFSDEVVSPLELFDDWPGELPGGDVFEDVAAYPPRFSCVLLFVFERLHELFGCGLLEQVVAVCAVGDVEPGVVRHAAEHGN